MMKEDTAASNGKIGGIIGGISAFQTIGEELDEKISKWENQIRLEQNKMTQERKELEQLKMTLNKKEEEINKGVKTLQDTIQQVQALKKELDSRLSIIPMDLDAAALQREWLQIDNEKVILAKATRTLEEAMDRLADSQAAFEILIDTNQSLDDSTAS